MSNFRTIDMSDLSSSVNNSAVLHHQIEKKRIRTVGNDCNRVSHTTTATSSAKIEVISTAQGKSVVSSLSVSLERKDSLQCKPRQTTSCTIPTGQNTVVHLDNYTHFIAQRVTTKKAMKRNEIVNKYLDSSSYHCSTENTSNGNKQKLQDSKSATSKKLRGRKNTLPSEYKSDDFKTTDIKMTKPNTSTKKRANRRKKSVRAAKTGKSKIKVKTAAEKDTANEDTDEVEIETLPQVLSSPPTSKHKILRPCVYTLQGKKCLSQLVCPYLHSDFPCKYYYLNIPCPKDVKCQFMHNGPLEPDLKEALRNHILHLLSPKPSAVETYFLQQMHYIEDLSHRLQSFQLKSLGNSHAENYEVIEIMDDKDEDPVLVVADSSSNLNTSNIYETSTTNLSNFLHSDDESMAPPPNINNLDMMYENIKRTNYAIDKIKKKLTFIRTNPNISPNKKNKELQKMYDLLKEHDKRINIYENLSNTTNGAQLSITCDNRNNDCLSYSAVESIELPHVFAKPELVNGIQNSENPVNVIDNESIINNVNPQPIKTDLRRVVGNEFLTNEEKNVVNVDGDINMPIVEYKYLQATNSNVQHDTILVNDLNNASSMDYEIQPATNIETIRRNDSNLNVKEKTEQNNEVTKNLNSTITIANNTFGELPEVTIQLQCDRPLQVAGESLDKNNSLVFNKNKSSNLHNETMELEITNDEEEIIDTNIKESDNEEVKSPLYEDHLAAKPENTNRICLRSHAIHDNEGIDGEKSIATSLEQTRPIRSRRLRLPKPSQKTKEKSDIDNCQINGEIINNLIEHTENSSKDEVEVPFRQSVTLTNRFMKKLKSKLTQQSLSCKKESPVFSNCTDACVEQKMHKCINSIENINENKPLSLLRNPLLHESGCNNLEFVSDDISLSGKICDKNQSDSCSYDKSPSDIEKNETTENHSSRRRISFETHTSSLATLSSSTIKEKFNLGNPHVVLTKIKTPRQLQTIQQDIQADSTTSYVTPYSLLSDDRCKQKRCSFEAECDLDSSLKESKFLKIENSKSRVTIDNRKRKLSQQSNDSRDLDFDIASSDEKLTIASSYNSKEQHEEAFEPSSTHEQQHDHTFQYEHKELQENESNLHQQIENDNNKSNLQLQTQPKDQQRFQQQKEVENTQTETTPISITESSKNVSHKQKQLQEIISVEEKKENDVVYQKQYEENEIEDGELTNTSNSCNSVEKDEDGHAQFLTFERICVPEKLNEIAFTRKETNVEYSTYSSMSHKMSNYAKKCQINFEKPSINTTPISSPSYCDDTIASPSPVRKVTDFRMGDEIDGSLTNPPIPYILHEIDLEKLEINKPLFFDKLKKTTQLDPRIFKTNIKAKQSIAFCKPIEANKLITSNTVKFPQDHSAFSQLSTSMISPYDPRSRISAVKTDVAMPSLSQQTALTTYNRSVATSSTSSSFFHTGIPNAVPLALQYHSTSQPIVQPQQQQTPNMFLYACLQRSPWYHSLMSTMKIQINQSISQLVRALNNFHRERVFNPEIVFDVFKIDCAGELLEIMRNLGVFVDANGVINEQRQVPSFAGRPCCNEVPVNATYSFIQQFLTPNTQCTSLTTAPSTCGTPVAQLNANEPTFSCYVKAPEPIQKPLDDRATAHQPEIDDNNCNKNFNNNRNENNSNNYDSNHNNNRRYGNQFKKSYDSNNANNNYQQRSNQRSSYNNNPRFMKPSSSSPTRSTSSPTNSPRRGYGASRGRGEGGRFNNNRRFNNYNNGDKNGSSSWSSDSKEKRYNNKYPANNSSSHASSPNSSTQSAVSPRAAETKTSSPPAQSGFTNSSQANSSDEECWDSDN